VCYENFKLHKVANGHYAGETVEAYLISQQIYLGNYVLNFSMCYWYYCYWNENINVT